MNLDDTIHEDIKSVNIRSTEVRRRLIMSSSSVETFQSFLKENINDKVLVLNTNIGMEVYYYSAENYSVFIKESMLLYTLKHIDHTKLRFKNFLNQEQVHRSFQEALFTFAQYPQIFLAYAKKFLYLSEKNSNSKLLMPILNNFFEEGLQLLAKTSNVPHFEKIQKTKNKSWQSDLNNDVIKNLISEILLKRHRN